MPSRSTTPPGRDHRAFASQHSRDMVKTARADDAQTLASFADEPDRGDVDETASTEQSMSVFNGDEQLPDEVANVSRDDLRKYVQCKRVGNYLLGKTVGEGSFAKVKEALHIPTGEKVAIKIIDKNRARKDRYVSKNMRREARLLQMIRHPHIVQLLEVVETTQCYYLVFEFADGGDLMDYICKRGKLDEEEVKKFIRQIISAVEYIHRLGIIHRDLKVENLLLDANNNIKIIDFGLSNTIFSSDPKNENHCTTQCGSPAYAAPELLVRKDYGPQIDVWSIGVNMYAMLTGRLPYTCEPFNISTLYHKMLMKEMNSVPEYLTEGCKDFIHQLLNPNPVERVSLLQATRNTWLTNMQKEPILLITCPNYLREEDLDDRILDHVESALNLNSDDVVRDVIQNRATRNSCVYYLLLRRLNRYKREYKDIMASVQRSPPPTTTTTTTPTTTATTTSGGSTPDPASPTPPESGSKPGKTHIIENPFKTLKVALIRQKKASKCASKSSKSVTFSAPKTATPVDNNNQLCEVKKVALVKVAPAKRSIRGVLSSARNLTSASSSSVGSRRKSYFDSLQQRRKSPKVRRRNPDGNDDSRSSIGSNSQTSVLSKTAREAVRRRSQVMEMTLHEGKVSNHNSPRNTITDEPAGKCDAVADMDLDERGTDVECVNALLESLAEYKDENIAKTIATEAEKRSVTENDQTHASEMTPEEGIVAGEDPSKTTAPEANGPASVRERTQASTSDVKASAPSKTVGAEPAVTASRPLGSSAGQSRRTSVESCRLSVSTKGSSGSSVERKGAFKSGSRVSFTGSRLDLRSSGGSVDIKVNGAQDENGEVIKEIGRLVNARISSITNRMSGEKFKPINDVYNKTRPVSGGGLASLRSGSSRSNLSRREPVKPTYQLPSARTNTYRQAGALNSRTAALTNRYVAKTRNEPAKLSDKYTKFLTDSNAASSYAKSKFELEGKQGNIGRKNTVRSDMKKPGVIASSATTANQDIIPNWRKNLKRVDENRNGVVTRPNKTAPEPEDTARTSEKAPKSATADQKGRTTTNEDVSKTQVQNKLNTTQDTKVVKRELTRVDTQDDTGKRVNVEAKQSKDHIPVKNGEKVKGNVSKGQRKGSRDLNEGVNVINELNAKRSQILLRKMDPDLILKSPEPEVSGIKNALLRRTSDDQSKDSIHSGAVDLSTSVKQGSEVRKLNTGLTKQFTNAENKKEGNKPTGTGSKAQAYLQKTRTQTNVLGLETKNTSKAVYGANKNNDKARNSPQNVVKDGVKNSKIPSTPATDKNTGKITSVERRPPRITENSESAQPRRNSTATERRGSATTPVENPVERLRRNFTKPEGEANKMGQTVRRNSTKADGSAVKRTPPNTTTSTTDKNKPATPRRNSAKTDNEIGSTLKKTSRTTDQNKAVTPRRDSTKNEAMSERPAPLSNGAKGARGTANKASAAKPLQQKGDQKPIHATESAKTTFSARSENDNTKSVYGSRKTPSSTKPITKDNGVLPASRSLNNREPNSPTPTTTHAGSVHSLRKSLTATFGETVKSGAMKIKTTDGCNNRSANGPQKTANSAIRKYSGGQPPKSDDVLRKTSWTGGERRQIAAYRTNNTSLRADDGKELKPVGPIPTYRRTAYKSCS